jgi:hypothetical protein
MSTNYTDKQYAEAMVKLFRSGAWDENDYSVDEPPAVSNGDDDGAYVQVWYWLSDDEMKELGFKPQNEEATP